MHIYKIEWHRHGHGLQSWQLDPWLLGMPVVMSNTPPSMALDALEEKYWPMAALEHVLCVLMVRDLWT